MWIRPLLVCVGIELVLVLVTFWLIQRSMGGWGKVSALLASESGQPKEINWQLRIVSWLVLLVTFCWSFVVGVFYSIWEFLRVAHG